MNAISVKRLRLKASQQNRSRAVFCIEDAMRTEIVSNDRLVLMRQLKLDRRASSNASHVRAHAVRSAFALEASNACHASSAGAGTANCVWFSDVSEARRMLLSMLIRGVEIHGWFWDLAIPLWQGKSLAEWTETRLAEALASSRPAALIELIEEFVTLGALDKLVRIVVKSGAMPTRDMDEPGSALASPFPHADRPEVAVDQPADASIEIQAAALLSRLPKAMHYFLRLVRQAGLPAGPVFEKLTEYMLLEAAPALSLNGPHRMLLVREVVARLELASASPRVAPGKSARAKADKASIPESSVYTSNSGLQRKDEESKAATPRDQPDEQALENSAANPRNRENPIQQPEDFWRRATRLKTKAAGLWLVIPTMIRCGWREWLQDHPELLADDPGGLMLCIAAQHHRVDPLDDTLSPLGGADENIIEPEWARLWRRGINGWLYHKTRVRLHDLIWRPGEIDISEERVNIHFPLADADIRLRMFALDVDPGWTDWLGLSVRYHFGERG